MRSIPSSGEKTFECVVSIPFVWGGKEDSGVFINALTWPCLTVLHGSVPLLEI